MTVRRWILPASRRCWRPAPMACAPWRVRTSARDIPIFAVGPQTADAAARAGFLRVRSADGDAAALADAVPHWADPAAGALLHAAGAEGSGWLARKADGARLRGSAAGALSRRSGGAFAASGRPGCSQGNDVAGGVVLFAPQRPGLCRLRRAGGPFHRRADGRLHQRQHRPGPRRAWPLPRSGLPPRPTKRPCWIAFKRLLRARRQPVIVQSVSFPRLAPDLPRHPDVSPAWSG